MRFVLALPLSSEDWKKQEEVMPGKKNTTVSEEKADNSWSGSFSLPDQKPTLPVAKVNLQNGCPGMDADNVMIFRK